MIRERIDDAIKVKQELLRSDELIETIQKVQTAVTAAFREGYKVWFCGNGGSAADAQHLAAECSGRFYKDRPALYAEALHCNTSYLTAVANDYSFDDVYARMIEGIGKPGDVLIVISTSGNSENIVRAAKAAREKNMLVIAMTGENGGRVKEQCNYLINIPSSNTARIQEAHVLVGHILCEQVEQDLFPE